MNAAEDVDCEPRESDVRSGPALVAYLQSVPYHTCINPLFNGPVDIRRIAFQEELVIHVMDAAAELSITYDGTNSTGLDTLFYFMQAAYYNEWYEDDIDFTAGVDEAMVGCLDQFMENAHFHDISDEHGVVLHQVFISLDSLNTYRIRYLPVARDWFTGLDERHFEHWSLLAATNSLFTWMYRGHWDQEFLEHVLADSEALLDVLLELALRDSMDSDRYKVFNCIGAAVCNSIPRETHREPARARPSVPWSP